MSAIRATSLSRIWAITGIVLVAFLYLLYLGFTLRGVARLYAAPLEGWPADFMRFWFAGRHYLPAAPQPPGDYALLFSTGGNQFTKWLYPPTMDVLAALAAVFPYRLSMLVWNVVCLGISSWALRRAQLPWGAIVFGLGGTAGLQNLAMGQNGILTGGLLAAALLRMPAQPRLTGTLAGLLVIKPQTGLILPAVLLHRYQRTALLFCALSAVGMCLLGLALTGPAGWAWYFTEGRKASLQVLTIPFQHVFFAAGATPFFMLRSFGASLHTASIVQSLCAAAAFGAVWLMWRRPPTDALHRAAVTLCLAALLSPYGFFYDLVGYSIAMAALCWRAPPALKPLYALLWLTPGYSGVLAGVTSHIFMPVSIAAALVLLALTAPRAQHASCPPNAAPCS